MLHKIKFLVFDLDYLIFDCAALKERALRQSLVPFADRIPTSVPLPDATDIEAGFLETGSNWIYSLQLGLSDGQMLDLEQEYRTREARFVESGMGRLFHGVRDLIAFFRREGLILALGAEARRDYLLGISDRLGLDQVFELMFCTEEYGMGCAEEMLDDLVLHAEVHPSETLILGTRASYFEAGRNLNIPSIGCGWGLQQSRDLSTADFQSPSITHLAPLIRQADFIAASTSE